MAWADVILGDGETAALTDGLRRPDTSVVAIESFGVDGPLAGTPASEFTLQAWCGLMSGCGTAATPPLQMGIAHGRWATGAMAALGALAAHRYAGRTGTGVGGGGQRARGDGRLPEQLPRPVPTVHRLGVVHVAQRRLAPGRPLQGRLDRALRVHRRSSGPTSRR